MITMIVWIAQNVDNDSKNSFILVSSLTLAFFVFAFTIERNIL
jgi:hypothetical protein